MRDYLSFVLALAFAAVGTVSPLFTGTDLSAAIAGLGVWPAIALRGRDQ